MVQLSLAEVLEQVWISPINWLIYLVEMGKPSSNNGLS